MGVYTGFGYAAPAGATQDTGDTSNVSLGCRFEVTQSGLYASAVRFYSAGTLPAFTRIGGIYSSDTGGALTVLAQATFAAVNTAGWQRVVITPTALTTGVDYYAVAYFQGGNYSLVTNVHGSDVVSGPVTVIAHSASTPNSVYNYATGISAPRTHFNLSWYCVDIEVDDGRPSNAAVSSTAAVVRAATW